MKRFVAAALLGVVGCGADRPAARSPADSTRVTLSTLIGGAGPDVGRDVTFDSAGNAYVAGWSGGVDFPVTPGTMGEREPPGLFTASLFLLKLDPEGRLAWSTALSGPSSIRAMAVAVAPDGDVLVAGRTGAGLPVTPGVVQTAFDDGGDTTGAAIMGFVCRLRADGSGIVWCTYLGAPGSQVTDLAVDSSGVIVVATATAERPPPEQWLRVGFPARSRGGSDAVVGALSGDGARALWATGLGGSGRDLAPAAVRMGPDGSVFALFQTESPDLPVRGDAVNPGGMSDLYLARLAPGGRRLIYGSRVGGRDREEIETHGLAVGSDGSAWITGATRSRDLAVTPRAVRPERAGGSADSSDAFVARLAPDGRLVAVTYLGGGGPDILEGIAMMPGGDLVLVGATSSSGLPGATSADSGAGPDLLMVVLAPGLDTVRYLSRIGGAAPDIGRSVAVRADGFAVVTGHAGSWDWPSRSAWQTGVRGRHDALVMRYDLRALPPFSGGR